MTKLTNRTLHLFLSPPTVTWSNPFCLLFLPLPKTLCPTIMATWAYPPLPQHQLDCEADSALVRTPPLLEMRQWS